jgi:exodeoxyribonuclease VII large subunit
VTIRTAAPQAALSPSALAAAINRALGTVDAGWVEGEVRDFQVARSGHAYLTLADSTTNLNCCIWRSDWSRVCASLARPLENGMLVKARFRRVSFYAKKGTTSLHLDDLRPTGEGELLARVAETLARLQADGLCDPGRKPALPRFPRRIGLITGHDAHARADVVKAIRDRFPPADIVCISAAVEGARCVDEVIGALACLELIPDVDVIVLSRGGGSVEALYPFSDERLCRAIFACRTPVVTSIGHTKHRPNCDHVAAAVADVPGRVAELVVPSKADVCARLDAADAHVAQAASRLRALRHEIAATERRLRIGERIRERRLAVELSGSRLNGRATAFYRRLRDQLDAARGALAERLAAIPRSGSLDVVGQRLATAARVTRARLREQRSALLQREGALRERARSQAFLARKRLAFAAAGLERSRARHELAAAGRQLDRLEAELARRARRSLARSREQVQASVALMDARDWRQRGFAIVAGSDGRPRSSVLSLAVGEQVSLQFGDGTATSTVTGISADATERTRRSASDEQGKASDI